MVHWRLTCVHGRRFAVMPCETSGTRPCDRDDTIVIVLTVIARLGTTQRCMNLTSSCMAKYFSPLDQMEVLELR